MMVAFDEGKEAKVFFDFADAPPQHPSDGTSRIFLRARLEDQL
jgi:hypothetical protein